MSTWIDTGSAEWPFLLNLLFGWVWILGGFVAGALLGMGFEKDQFLGGYTSFRRRLYRLGHIAFFGTGMLNLLFYFTVSTVGPEGLTLAREGGVGLAAAAWAFLAGALSMPAACLLCASFPKLKPVFALPVIALTTGGVLTCLEVVFR